MIRDSISESAFSLLSSDIKREPCFSGTLSRVPNVAGGFARSLQMLTCDRGLRTHRSKRDARVPQQLPACTSRRQCPVHAAGDRKSTRLNSSHVKNSYAVFCLKK